MKKHYLYIIHNKFIYVIKLIQWINYIMRSVLINKTNRVVIVINAIKVILIDKYIK